MKILGGSYRETCEVPESEEVAGSGLRAAGAIAAAATPTLHTAIDGALQDAVEIVAGGLGVDLDWVGRDETVGFRYFTPLSNPTIDGPSAGADAMRVEGDTVLAFGMVEAGERSVDCKRLVIDPQRPRDLSRLDLDGYRCDQLALVCNSNEILALSGATDLVEAADAARGCYRADVVVVKRGAVGAMIVTNDVTHVGPHPTTSVWPIGSGDVFAGAFARCWGSGVDAVEAARAASAAAAWWCGTKSPTVPAEILDGGPPQHSTVAAVELKVSPAPKVYLAGPFFDLPQRWLVELARNSLLGLGAEVFSPFHDVGPGGDEVAAADLEGLGDCGAVLALTDGWDAGTLYECGWASRADIPIIAFGANPQSEGAKMLVGDGAEIHGDFSTAVYRSIWAAAGMELTPDRYPIEPA
ncbi:MAG: PfkB family carbohydrate kinase [bacterium]|nr:PfkB family carbohydrate kinase [bacterium]